MKITTVGVNWAKSVFSMHGIDEHGNAKAVLRQSARLLLEEMATDSFWPRLCENRSLM
jgi:hypothetical protein